MADEKKGKDSKKASEADFEKRVIKLGKEGLDAPKIGEALRKEGIHPKEYSKKILKILKENDLYENPDIKYVEKKLERIKSHFGKNKQDKRAMREKDRVFAHLRKLKLYHGYNIR